jgi:hypothetical protein
MSNRITTHIVSRLRDERGLGDRLILAKEASDLIIRLTTQRDEALLALAIIACGDGDAQVIAEQTLAVLTEDKT